MSDTALVKSMLSDPYIGKWVYNWIYSGHSLYYVLDVYGGPRSSRPDCKETYLVIKWTTYELILCGLLRSVAMTEYLIGGAPDLNPRHKREFNHLARFKDEDSRRLV